MHSQIPDLTSPPGPDRLPELTHEQARLTELDAYNILDTPPEPAFDRITRLATNLLAAPIGVINFIDGERQWFKSCIGLPVSETSREVSICATTILTAEALVVPDLRNDARFELNPLVACEGGLRFYAGAPLVTPLGYHLGTLCVIDRVPRPQGISLKQLEALVDLAAMVVDELELRTNSKQLQLVMDTIPALISYVGPDCRYRRANRAYKAWFGISKEQVRGRHIREVVGEEYFESVTPYIESALRGETAVFEARMPKQQTERYLQGSYMPDVDEKGKVRGFVILATDITERHENEEMLRKLNRELEEFAYVASHDLQEPLRMINIYTHMLLRRCGNDDPALNEYAHFIRDGVTRMEQLIRDLLTYSRAVHEEEVAEGTADLAAALADAMSVLQSRIAESNASVRIGTLPVVPGDATQLSHVFQNLLSNSIKYGKPGVAPEIVVFAELEGDRWLITVRDNGIGFHPRYAERIFGLFKRLHKEQYPGTGLGLAICQRVIERYGGKIWAEGRPDEGATFRFTLPYAGHVAATIA